jgi:hypothetical protein
MKRTMGMVLWLAASCGCATYDQGQDPGDRYYTGQLRTLPGPAPVTWNDNPGMPRYQYAGGSMRAAPGPLSGYPTAARPEAVSGPALGIDPVAKPGQPQATSSTTFASGVVPASAVVASPAAPTTPSRLAEIPDLDPAPPPEGVPCQDRNRRDRKTGLPAPR